LIGFSTTFNSKYTKWLIFSYDSVYSSSIIVIV
jgi:hypothetical protein